MNEVKRHNVTLYIPTRVKVTNVPGQSHIEAIDFVESNFAQDIEKYLTKQVFTPLRDDIGIAYSEPDEDLTNYLVDEVGDTEYSNTRVYELDRITDRSVVECPGGQTQFDQMKCLFDEIAICFQAGSRTEDVDWDHMTPLLDRALDLLGRDRIEDLEAAEAYVAGDFDPFDEDEQAFVVVRLMDQSGYYYRAVIPESLRPKMSKAFENADAAYAYVRDYHAKLAGEIEEDGSDFPLMRVVLCKESKGGVFRAFNYNS